MSDSLLVINGRELDVPADQANAYYRLIHEIVTAGHTRTVILDVRVDGEPAKFAVLITPSTQASLLTNDVAAMTKPFYTSNATELLNEYLSRDVDPES